MEEEEEEEQEEEERGELTASRQLGRSSLLLASLLYHAQPLPFSINI